MVVRITSTEACNYVPRRREHNSLPILSMNFPQSQALRLPDQNPSSNQFALTGAFPYLIPSSP